MKKNHIPVRIHSTPAAKAACTQDERINVFKFQKKFILYLLLVLCLYKSTFCMDDYKFFCTLETCKDDPEEFFSQFGCVRTEDLIDLINDAVPTGFPALHILIKNHKNNLLKYFLSLKTIVPSLDGIHDEDLTVDTTIIDGMSGRGLLHEACACSNTQATRMLIAINPDLIQSTCNCYGKTSNWTPLHFAARSLNADIVKLLLDNSAHPDTQSEFGDTPLMILLETDVTAKSSISCLKYISEELKRERFKIIFDLLLTHGANPCTYNKQKQTTLHCAAQTWNVWAIERLLAAGAEINSLNANNQTALSVALESYSKKKKDGTDHTQLHRLVSIFLAAGADVNTVDNINVTPLHHAALITDNAHTVQQLLDAGANPNLLGKESCTARHWAMGENLHEVVKVFDEFEYTFKIFSHIIKKFTRNRLTPIISTQIKLPTPVLRRSQSTRYVHPRAATQLDVQIVRPIPLRPKL